MTDRNPPTVEPGIPHHENECEECNDALATTGAWFNGRTWVRLCAGCYVWWENHALIEAKDESR